MKKRMLSLLCVLALCLSLLPATALAAGEDAPAKLYVGDQHVIVSETVTYWTTDESGGLTRDYDATDNSTDWSVRYDQNTATLTLRGATIKTTNTSGNYAVIYAQSNSQSAVSLTIQLEGTNTIVCDSAYYGIYVNAEMSGTSYGKDASLTITGNGSLDVSGSSYGIYVKSGSGDASLTIENASVVANTTSQSYSGVVVQSSSFSQNSPALSLAVNGGSLTANGGDNGAGIQFNVVSSDANDATTSLTVKNNAIVKAINGIKVSHVDKPIPSGTGIVFDDKEGTVYGNVTLDESLTINQGETLTIPEGSTLNTNNKLTNNGTVTIENGGTLNGSDTINNTGTINVENGGTLGGTPTGTVVYAPTITTQPAGQEVTVGQTATFIIEATGENLSYQWQQKTSGSDWTDIASETNATYTTGQTTMDMSGYQYRCVVSNSAGSVTSNAATLTVTQPVTGVTLNESNLSMFTGESKTLTATVEPETATDKSVTWESSDITVATVDQSGNVKAEAQGTATITVKTANGGFTDTCTVTVTDKTYTITADPSKLAFGAAYTGYDQPAAKTVTVTNTGNQSLTLDQPASTNSFEVGSLSKTQLAPAETATFTVQPKAGLAVGTYNESIKVTGSEGTNLSIPATFTVRQYISPPTKTPSQQAMDKIEAAKDGDTVEITLSTGNTKLDKEVFEELAGRDVTLEINLPGGVSWTVNGQDIPENATLTDLDMGVSMNTSTIPVNLINMVTGEKGAVQMTLAHDGEFGFTMTLTAPVGTENKGLWANLYHYDTTRKQMLFETAAQVDASGNVALKFSHASEYAIVLDTKSHELPFDDVNVGDWFQAAVEYVYRNGIMTGTSVTTFEPGTTLSRAMVAQILYNLEGQPAVTEATTFTDSGTHWAAKAIAWAQETGVVSGYEDNTFRPNKAVTREELAQMLYNYAKVKDYDLTASGDLTAFPDGVEVSSWAETAMAWANGNKLINGHDDGTLEPGGDSTRAQAASILMNFDVKLVQ